MDTLMEKQLMDVIDLLVPDSGLELNQLEAIVAKSDYEQLSKYAGIAELLDFSILVDRLSGVIL